MHETTKRRPATKVELACNDWLDDAMIKGSMVSFSGSTHALVVALIRASFMEGAKYATDRCDREHG